MVNSVGNPLSNCDPFDLIETHLVAPPIVELRGPRRGMIRHSRGLFQGAAVLQVGRDPRRPNAVAGEHWPRLLGRASAPDRDERSGNSECPQDCRIGR